MNLPGDIDRRIIVWNKHKAESRRLFSEYIVISINDTPLEGDPDSSTWANVKEGYRAILRVNFDDTDHDGPVSYPILGVGEVNLKPCTREQAAKIVRFWNKWKDNCDQILIHCTAGMSRSAGVAVALSVLEGIPQDCFYQHCFPNSLVKRRVISQAYALGIGIWGDA